MRLSSEREPEKRDNDERRESYPRPTALTVVSQGMHSTNGEAVAYPEQSTVLGPCKVIPRELPGVTCVNLDLESPSSASESDGGSLLALANKIPGVSALNARLGLNKVASVSVNGPRRSTNCRPPRRWDRWV